MSSLADPFDDACEDPAARLAEEGRATAVESGRHGRAADNVSLSKPGADGSGVEFCQEVCAVTWAQYS